MSVELAVVALGLLAVSWLAVETFAIVFELRDAAVARRHQCRVREVLAERRLR